MKRAGTAHGARAHGSCFGTLSTPISGAPTERSARANGGMLSARLTASMPTCGPLPLPLDELAQDDAHAEVDHRLAQLTPPSRGYLRQRQAMQNFWRRLESLRARRDASRNEHTRDAVVDKHLQRELDFRAQAARSGGCSDAFLRAVSSLLHRSHLLKIVQRQSRSVSSTLSHFSHF